MVLARGQDYDGLRLINLGIHAGGNALKFWLDIASELSLRL